MLDMLSAEFAPFARSSPFLDRIGGIAARRAGNGIAFGVPLAAAHCNNRGTAHGGLIATLADLALGYNLALAAGSRERPFVTVSLAVDFIGPASVGELLTASAEAQKADGRLGFVRGELHSAGRLVARCSGIFA